MMMVFFQFIAINYSRLGGHCIRFVTEMSLLRPP